MVKKWRTRTKGTKRQKGKRFMLGSSQQKLKTELKPINAKTPTIRIRSKIRSTKTNIPKMGSNVESTRTRTPMLNVKVRSTKTRIPKMNTNIVSTKTPMLNVSAKIRTTKTRVPTIRKLTTKEPKTKGATTREPKTPVPKSMLISKKKNNPCPSKKRKRKRSVPKWARKRTYGEAQEYLDRSTVRKQIA